MWLVDYVPKLLDFNSHARVGRDTRLTAPVTKTGNFNSHARVGRDWMAVKFPGTKSWISTHTPV